MKATERVIILKPHPMGWLYLWVICLLAVPLFGLGLLAGFFLWKHIRSISYRLGDERLESHEDGRVSVVSWDSVTDAFAISRAGRLGHVALRTEAGEVRLLFLEDAYGLAETIRAMLSARRTSKKETFVHRESDMPIGNDRLNDLTSLWHEGLISEEDYQSERKHFT